MHGAKKHEDNFSFVLLFHNAKSTSKTNLMFFSDRAS